jgi:hypothetical protein
MNFQAIKHRRMNPASPIHWALFTSAAIYRGADVANKAKIKIQFTPRFIID